MLVSEKVSLISVGCPTITAANRSQCAELSPLFSACFLGFLTPEDLTQPPAFESPPALFADAFAAQYWHGTSGVVAGKAR